MVSTLSVTFLVLALATSQIASQLIVPGLSPYIPSLPPYVGINPVIDYLPLPASCGCGASIVDVQSYTAQTCGCGSAVPYSPCSYPFYECGVPTSVSAPACGCGCLPPVPLPTVPYSSVQAPCGCGLATPLLPPLPPVVGCSKYLRQVCTQPPFL